MSDQTDRECKCGATYKKKRSKDPNLCQVCRKEYIDAWRSTNRDKLREYAKRGLEAMRERDPKRVKAMFARSARKRRKRIQEGSATLNQVMSIHIHHIRHSNNRARKIPVSQKLTKDFLISLLERQQWKCAISGLTMSIAMKEITAISVDRRDSSGGYIPSNVQLVCRWVNFAKSNFSDDDIKRVLDLVRSTPL